MAELLLEKAKELGMVSVYAELPIDEDRGRLDDEKLVSQHILQKLGFRFLKQTDRHIHMKKDLQE